MNLGYVRQEIFEGYDSSVMLSNLLPNDSMACPDYEIKYIIDVDVDNSTGTFNETYTFRMMTPTPVPEPSASLAIPSGVAMLLALSKLRGASLVN